MNKEFRYQLESKRLTGHQPRLTQGIDYNVSDRLEQYPPNTDLCDLLLSEV